MNRRIGARAALASPCIAAPVCLCLVTSCMVTLCLAALGLAMLGLMAPVPIAAQGVARWFPDVEPFKPLIAAPREVQVRGSFVYANRPDGGYDGGNIEAEVVVGHSVGLVRLDDGSAPRRAIIIGVEVGVFSRFFMEMPQKDLINSDFRVGFPLAIRSGSWEYRLTIRHFSAHLGDDYFVRFSNEILGEFTQTSKDGFEGVLARKLGEGGRLYVGGEYNFHTNENMSRAGLRFGGEWDPVEPGEGSGRWPFLAGDFEYVSFSEQLAATLVGGMGLRVNGRLLRLEARARFGFTPMGHFRETDETYFGLGFSLDL